MRSLIYSTCLVFAVLAPQSGQAATVATFSGVIANGYDGLGLFGVPDADLQGKPARMVFRYDNIASFNNEDGTQETGDWWIGSGIPNPLSLSISVSGHKLLFPVWTDGQIYFVDNSQYNDGIQYNDDVYYVFVHEGRYFSQDLNFFASGQLNAPNFLSSSSINQSLYYRIGEEGGVGWAQFHIGPNSEWATLLNIDVSSLRIESTEQALAVPEPESWLMLLFGFLMIGSAIRLTRPRRSPSFT